MKGLLEKELKKHKDLAQIPNGMTSISIVRLEIFLEITLA